MKNINIQENYRGFQKYLLMPFRKKYGKMGRDYVGSEWEEVWKIQRCEERKEH